MGQLVLVELILGKLISPPAPEETIPPIECEVAVCPGKTVGGMKLEPIEEEDVP